MKKLLFSFFALCLLALPAFAQFADQRQYAGASGGTANAQTVAIPNYALNAGVVIRFMPSGTNTGAMTLSVNGTAVKSVVKAGASGPVALTGGEIIYQQLAEVIYDGLYYELLNPALTAPANGGTGAASPTGIPQFNGASAPTFITPGTGVAAALAQPANGSSGFITGPGPGLPGDGSDQTTAFQTLLTSLATTGGSIKLPCGVYKFTSAETVSISAGKSISIYGSAGCTELYFTAGQGFSITYGSGGSAFYLSDLSVTTGGVGTGNPGVTLTASAGSPVLYSVSPFHNVTFRGHDGLGLLDYWSIGVSLINVSNVVFDSSVAFYGGPNGSSYTSNGTGIKMTGTSAGSETTVVNVVGTSFFYEGKGVDYEAYSQGLNVAPSTNFVGGYYGAYVGAGATGATQLNVVGVQCNVYVSCAYDAYGVPGAIYTNNFAIVPTGSLGIAFWSLVARGSYYGDNYIAGASSTDGATAIKIGSGTGIIAPNTITSIQTAINVSGNTFPGSILPQNIYSVGTSVNGSSTWINNSVAGASQIPGTVTNDAATTGNLGEDVISSVVPCTTNTGLTTATPSNITSVALTAGDWDVRAVVGYDPAGTTVFAGLTGGISLTSGNGFPAQGAIGRIDSNFSSTGVVEDIGVGPIRVSLSTAVSVYLNETAYFSVSTAGKCGQIEARRVR